MKVIVVEDNPVYNDYVCNFLKKGGFDTMQAYRLSTAKKLLAKAEEDNTVLADLRLPDGEGVDLLRWMRKEGKPQPFIIMTDYAEVHTAVESMKLGSADYIPKQLVEDRLVPLTPPIKKKRKKKKNKTRSVFGGGGDSKKKRGGGGGVLAPPGVGLLVGGGGGGKEIPHPTNTQQKNEGRRRWGGGGGGGVPPLCPASSLLLFLRCIHRSRFYPCWDISMRRNGGTLFLGRGGKPPVGNPADVAPCHTGEAVSPGRRQGRPEFQCPHHRCYQ